MSIIYDGTDDLGCRVRVEADDKGLLIRLDGANLQTARISESEDIDLVRKAVNEAAGHSTAYVVVGREPNQATWPVSVHLVPETAIQELAELAAPGPRRTELDPRGARRSAAWHLRAWYEVVKVRLGTESFSISGPD